MLSKRRIAFIKMGPFSGTNDSVYEMLSKEFKHLDIEVVDIWNDIISKKNIFNILHCLIEYKIDILCGKKRLMSFLAHTTYFFNTIKKELTNRIASRNIFFTFQTQSIFDAKIPGVPNFVYTDHTHLANLEYVGFNKDNLYHSKWIELESQIYSNAELVFTMSSNISKSLIKDYACSPLKVVQAYCGNNAKFLDVSTDDSNYESKNILFVGKDWERKGGPQLIEAFKEVLKVHPDAKLTIVGCSPKLNIQNCIVKGYLPLSEVRKYFQQASIFCMPTRIEPFGIVFIEAMSYKLPVIGTRIGALPDFIKDGVNGYLVNLDETQNLALKLIDLLNDSSKCKQFGENGYGIYRESYNWNNTGRIIRESIERSIGPTSEIQRPLGDKISGRQGGRRGGGAGTPL